MSEERQSLLCAGCCIEVFNKDISELMPELPVPIIFYCEKALLEIFWCILALLGQKVGDNFRIHVVDDDVGNRLRRRSNEYGMELTTLSSSHQRIDNSSKFYVEAPAVWNTEYETRIYLTDASESASTEQAISKLNFNDSVTWKGNRHTA